MEYVLFLHTVQKNLYQFAGPILMLIGNVSCILSCLVFSRKNLRKNPCSIYFIALSLSDLLFIYSSLFFAVLAIGYEIDPSKYNLGVCRFVIYSGFLFDSLSGSYLIIASIDRIFVTSPNARTRRLSTRRLALICIISITLIWALFHIHALILTSIQELTPNYFVCYFQPGLHATFIGYYTLIKGVLQPIILIICGVWTVRNIRGTRRVQVPPISSITRNTAPHNQNSNTSKDRQLVLMLLIDIFISVVFGLMITIVFMYRQITQYQEKDYQEIQLEIFLLNVGTFSGNIPYCVGLYTKLIISKTFRKEFKNTFLNIRLCRFY